MSCNGDSCPIHGARYMKSIRVGLDVRKRIRICRGCHAGEMAAREEYERSLSYHLYDETGQKRGKG